MLDICTTPTALNIFKRGCPEIQWKVNLCSVESLLRTRGKGGVALTLSESFRKNQWDRHSTVIQTKHAVWFYRPHKVKNYVQHGTAMRDYCPFQVQREKTSAEQVAYPHTPHVEAHSPSLSQSRISGGTLVGCRSHLPQRCSELSLQTVVACQNQWPVKEQLFIKNSITLAQTCSASSILLQKLWAFASVVFLLDQLSLSDTSPALCLIGCHIFLQVVSSPHHMLCLSLAINHKLKPGCRSNISCDQMWH